MKRISILTSSFALSAALTLMPGALMAQNSMGQSSMGSDNSGSHLSASDRKFVSAAAEGGMAEVELGQMAQQKGASDQVKQFGQRMVTDHTKANDQLKEVAMKEGIQLPTKLSAQDEMTKQRLSKLSGEQFDKAYMSDMVKDHTKDVADFQRESTSGQDPAVKDFASETLPTLQSHLQEAQQIDPATSTASR
jgi:putative membrane protein